MYEVNVDIPTKKCTLHRKNCSLKPGREPGFKGFGHLKRDGGWLQFDTDGAAERYYRREWQPQGYNWSRCPSCDA